jgi:hypothetical protein
MIQASMTLRMVWQKAKLITLLTLPLVHTPATLTLKLNLTLTLTLALTLTLRLSSQPR